MFMILPGAGWMEIQVEYYLLDYIGMGSAFPYTK